jgi:hypothetical protein
VSVEVLAAGHAEVKSSISAANVAVLNLYASLGFSFRHPLDVTTSWSVALNAPYYSEPAICVRLEFCAVALTVIPTEQH